MSIKITKKNLLLSFFLVLLLGGIGNSYANSSQYLIQEMEALRDSLKPEDSARDELTLRLADLYFDVSIQEGKGEDSASLKKNRLKALELYKKSLNGDEKLNKAEGLSKIKIQFQMARLLSRLGGGKMAETYYLEILAEKKAPKKMIEQSVLALAEWYEEEAKFVQAKKYYEEAISLCEEKSACNYAHYRLAWLFYKETQLDAAIASMEKALWIDDTTLRENSLADLFLFLSNKETDGTKEIEFVKNISQRSKREGLLRQLTEAFYIAGNRLAGSTLLEKLNEKDPNLYYETRLLEEFYGHRKWNKVEELLLSMEKRSQKDLPGKKEEQKEILSVLQRFIVQPDAEVQADKKLNNYLKRSIDIYLNLYPRDELRKKMQAGWLSAEENKNAKIEKLSKWISEDISYGASQEDIRKLRQSKLVLAQNLKLPGIVIEEAKAIALILKGTPEENEFLYTAARELYSEKRYEEALPIFNEIVASQKEKITIESFAILSQNLILDIYNTKKDYGKIVTQIAQWESIIKDAEKTIDLKKESASMEKMRVQAQFEEAFLAKDSPESLEKFYTFCMGDIYVEKSCPNAKVLSIKFRDQEKLVKVLWKMGDEKSLALEYELMGRYEEAAHLLEKLEPGQTDQKLENYIKIAFLYELDQKENEQKRILERMVEIIKREKKIPKDLEKTIFLTLEDANLLNEKSLAMPWSLSMKIKLASLLEIKNPSNTTQKILLSQTEDNGPVWSKLVLQELESQYKKANNIKFYGSKSQKLFKERTNKIEKFAVMAKNKLDAADLETRVYILHMLKMTYKKMAQEILNTPIPEGLDEETMAKVASQISTMADPFDQVNEDYNKLMEEQLAAMKNSEQKNKVLKNITEEVVSYADLIKVEPWKNGPQRTIGTEEKREQNIFRKKLLTDPEDKFALENLKNFYMKNDNKRLAAYYAERLENLRQVE